MAITSTRVRVLLASATISKLRPTITVNRPSGPDEDAATTRKGSSRGSRSAGDRGR